MIPYEHIKEFVFMGVKFEYLSYDHNKAMAEIEEIKKRGKPVPYQPNNLFELVDSCYGVPDEIKKNHIVWRTGKLRRLMFDNNSKMWKFQIGNRYVKNFYLEDFGVSVKPRIYKSDDRFDLIGQGLAVEETN